MKNLDESERGFRELRAAGIVKVQAASGNIWTDYNLHDPGVTLLEQTCFALTEVSYRAGHTVRDLLTDAKGHLAYDELAFFLPGRTLPGAPVTLLDLAAELAEDPRVARAVLAPGLRAGLIDVVVIPAPGLPGENRRQTDAAARQAIRDRFALNRPLCCDLGRVRVAKRRRTKLEAVVQIAPTATPDKVAAEIYYRVAAILRGVPVGSEIDAEATRKMVYDQPQAYLHAPSEQDGKIPKLDNHLSDLRSIPGIRDISEPDLRDIPSDNPTAEQEDPSDEAAEPLRAEADRIFYRDLAIPATDAEIGLRLEVDGVPVRLDAGRIVEERIRIAADAIARAKHHLDAEDWRPPTPGTRRDFTTYDVDMTLPAVYATAARRRRSSDDFQRYRGPINAHLAGLNRDLAQLPETFRLDPDEIPSDPAGQRRRIEVLDYQLALQGEVMPATRHAGLHLYRTAAERYAFEVSWRADFLQMVPELNRGRGLGPSTGPAGGFLAKFLHLADLRRGAFPEVPQTFEAIGLGIGPNASPLRMDVGIEDIDAPEQPLSLLMPRRGQAPRLDGSALRESCSWLSGVTIGSDLLVRLADSRNFFVSSTRRMKRRNRGADGSFAVLFDGGAAEGVHLCGRFGSREAALRHANALHGTWTELQRRSEGAVLVEDILLRDAPTLFSPHLAYMVMPGWTARCAQPPYRAYIAQLIEMLAPAHVHIRPLWLDFDACLRFSGLWRAAAESREGARRALRGFLIDAGCQDG